MKRTFITLLSILLVAAGMTGCAAQEVVAASSASQGAAQSSASTPVSSSESAELVEEASSEAPEIAPEEPDTDWQFDAPENHGVDSAALESVHDKIVSTDMTSLVVVKNGVIIDEYYKDGYDENSVFHLHSVTKSFMDALIGIAIDQGTIPGVDTKISEYFPQIAESGDARKQKVTIEHLLEHTSGFAGGDSGSNGFMRLQQAENWVDFTLALPSNAEPGTTFSYSTAGSHLLSAILEKATGESTLDFANDNLFEPIGITSAEWSLDPQGIIDGGNGLSLNTRDVARLGQLYLDQGNWRGKQIVPQAWVEESTKAQAAGEAGSGEYGYQWWVRSYGENNEYSGYYALGYAGQFVVVVPELDLVVAITSTNTWSAYTQQMCINDVIAASAAA